MSLPIGLLTGGSQVGSLGKKLVPLLRRLTYTVENDLKDFPWNWHQNFKHDAETFNKFKADLNNLMQDLSTKQFMATGLTYTIGLGIIVGIKTVIQMIIEIIALIKLIFDLIKLVKLFKKGFDRIKAYLEDMLNIQKQMGKAYALLRLAVDEAIRIALRKVEKMRQLIMLRLKLKIAEAKKASYLATKASLLNRLKNASNTQIGIIQNLIKKADLNAKETKAEIDYSIRAIDALNRAS